MPKDPREEDWDGLSGSPTGKVTALEESLHSPPVSSEENPSPTVPASPERPLHHSVTDNGPSKEPKEDLKAVLMSDCSNPITDDA